MAARVFLVLGSAALYAAALQTSAGPLLGWLALAPFLAACATATPRAGVRAGSAARAGHDAGRGVVVPGARRALLRAVARARLARVSRVVGVSADGLPFALFGAWLAWAARRGALTPLRDRRRLRAVRARARAAEPVRPARLLARGNAVRAGGGSRGTVGSRRAARGGERRARRAVRARARAGSAAPGARRRSRSPRSRSSPTARCGSRQEFGDGRAAARRGRPGRDRAPAALGPLHRRREPRALPRAEPRGRRRARDARLLARVRGRLLPVRGDARARAALRRRARRRRRRGARRLALRARAAARPATSTRCTRSTAAASCTPRCTTSSGWCPSPSPRRSATGCAPTRPCTRRARAPRLVETRSARVGAFLCAETLYPEVARGLARAGRRAARESLERLLVRRAAGRGRAAHHRDLPRDREPPLARARDGHRRVGDRRRPRAGRGAQPRRRPRDRRRRSCAARSAVTLYQRVGRPRRRPRLSALILALASRTRGGTT